MNGETSNWLKLKTSQDLVSMQAMKRKCLYVSSNGLTARSVYEKGDPCSFADVQCTLGHSRPFTLI